jgi:hypothetical protein
VLSLHDRGAPVERRTPKRAGDEGLGQVEGRVIPAGYFRSATVSAYIAKQIFMHRPAYSCLIEKQLCVHDAGLQYVVGQFTVGHRAGELQSPDEHCEQPQRASVCGGRVLWG